MELFIILLQVIFSRAMFFYSDKDYGVTIIASIAFFAIILAPIIMCDRLFT